MIWPHSCKQYCAFEAKYQFPICGTIWANQGRGKKPIISIQLSVGRSLKGGELKENYIFWNLDVIMME
jgi:hypothetical protein